MALDSETNPNPENGFVIRAGLEDLISVLLNSIED
jgi:hypothetical protein